MSTHLRSAPAVPPEPGGRGSLVPALLGRRDAAHYLGIGTTLLDALLAEGSIPARRIGRRVLIHRDDLDAYAKGLSHANA